VIQISPLQRAERLGRGGSVLLKREDLLRPAGGNKVHRFAALRSGADTPRRLVTLSDPGAHSFEVLRRFLHEHGQEAGIDRLLFLERPRVISPYQMRIRQRYLEDPRVEVRTGPLLLQLLRLVLLRLFARLTGDRVLGIGGHVEQEPNPHTEVFRACVEQLDADGYRGEVLHVFPIASGQMADGFLRYLRAHPQRRHRLLGLVTAPTLVRPWLWLKYWRRPEIELLPVRPVDYPAYLRNARDFHARSGVWLDPQHSIHLADFLHSTTETRAPTIVLWVTCPLIDGPA